MELTNFTTAKRWMLVGVFATAVATQAQLVLDVGTATLNPNQSGQTYNLFLRNDGLAPVSLTLNELILQVANGGPDSGVPNPISGPTISGFDSAFGVFGPTQPDGGNAGQRQLAAFTPTGSGEGTIIPGNNLIGTITFDTTGFGQGSWDLRVGNTVYGDSAFFGGSVTLDNGTVMVPVPEPSTYALFAGLGLMGFAGFRRYKANRAAAAVPAA